MGEYRQRFAHDPPKDQQGLLEAMVSQQMLQEEKEWKHRKAQREEAARVAAERKREEDLVRATPSAFKADLTASALDRVGSTVLVENSESQGSWPDLMPFEAHVPRPAEHT